MILRMWFGRAHVDTAAQYAEHVTTKVLPSLAEIPGHRGAMVLRREDGNEIEFAVLTMWDSMDAVRQFAGGHPDIAVVEPDARAVLSSFDETVRHFVVILRSEATKDLL
jgi:heme-degrading monooxygenase HmoA